MKFILLSPRSRSVYDFRGDMIKEIISLGHDVIVTGPDEEYLDKIKELGVRYEKIPFENNEVNIMKDIKYTFHLYKFLRKENPDVTLGYALKPVIYGGIAAKLAGVKKIYSLIAGAGRIYSSDSLRINLIRGVTGTLFKIVFKYCNMVIFQNTDDLDEFVDRGYLEKEKTAHVNGSGVNMKRFKAVPLPDEPIFLMVSRIIKEKGIFEYLNAARLVKKEYPEAKFILLGGYDTSIGSIKPEELKPYIDEGTVEYLGVVRNVIPILEKARFFILPTYYREGLPRTILEAMSMGKPIITTDWNGCRDAVKDNVNGLLVSPKSSEELAVKMKYILNKPNETLIMSRNSLKLCKERYDVNLVNKKMLEVMDIK